MHVVHKLLLNDVDYISYITKPIVISPPMDLRSTAMCVCVCMFVFVCPLAYLKKTTRLNFTNFSVHIACRRGSILTMPYAIGVCTSGFVDDVTFAHNGQAYSRRRSMGLCAQSDSPGAAPGAKSDIYDCLVLS